MTTTQDIYFGFRVGERVQSDGELGTVTSLSSPSGNEILGSCVPVLFDRNKGNGTIDWVEESHLQKMQ